MAPERERENVTPHPQHWGASRKGSPEHSQIAMDCLPDWDGFAPQGAAAPDRVAGPAEPVGQAPSRRPSPPQRGQSGSVSHDSGRQPQQGAGLGRCSSGRAGRARPARPPARPAGRCSRTGTPRLIVSTSSMPDPQVAALGQRGQGDRQRGAADAGGRPGGHRVRERRDAGDEGVGGAGHAAGHAHHEVAVHLAAVRQAVACRAAGAARARGRGRTARTPGRPGAPG